MSATTAPTSMSELICRLDEDVCASSDAERVERVKNTLIELTSRGHDFLDSRCLQPARESYARHLVHLCPRGRYSVLAMVWDVGQGTPIHDHAGMWCVECVYRGHIRVQSYDIQGQDTDPVVRFTREKDVLASPGSAGALIPPFDYHTITNADSSPSITIHVYGGEMDWCHAFLPVPGGFRRERRALRYSSR